MKFVTLTRNRRNYCFKEDNFLLQHAFSQKRTCQLPYLFAISSLIVSRLPLVHLLWYIDRRRKHINAERMTYWHKTHVLPPFSLYVPVWLSVNNLLFLFPSGARLCGVLFVPSYIRSYMIHIRYYLLRSFLYLNLVERCSFLFLTPILLTLNNVL